MSMVRFRVPPTPIGRPSRRMKSETLYGLQSTCWSRQLNTSLRVLIDEAIEDDLADEIATIPALFHAEFVRKISALKGRPDKEIMDYAKAENRIVITFDSDYNSANFPICTHPGIIRLAGKSRHRTEVSDMMKRFSKR